MGWVRAGQTEQGSPWVESAVTLIESVMLVKVSADGFMSVPVPTDESSAIYRSGVKCGVTTSVREHRPSPIGDRAADPLVQHRASAPGFGLSQSSRASGCVATQSGVPRQSVVQQTGARYRSAGVLAFRRAYVRASGTGMREASVRWASSCMASRPSATMRATSECVLAS